jgi:hypothetical protein
MLITGEISKFRKTLLKVRNSFLKIYRDMVLDMVSLLHKLVDFCFFLVFLVSRSRKCFFITYPGAYVMHILNAYWVVLGAILSFPVQKIVTHGSLILKIR